MGTWRLSRGGAVTGGWEEAPSGEGLTKSEGLRKRRWQGNRERTWIQQSSRPETEALATVLARDGRWTWGYLSITWKESCWALGTAWEWQVRMPPSPSLEWTGMCLVGLTLQWEPGGAEVSLRLGKGCLGVCPVSSWALGPSLKSVHTRECWQGSDMPACARGPGGSCGRNFN